MICYWCSQKFLATKETIKCKIDGRIISRELILSKKPYDDCPLEKGDIMQDSIEVMESMVDAFNERNPPGTIVTMIKDLGQKVKTKVRYPAEILSGHTPVVWLEGVTGCYLLSRVI